jgi:hypothetical protein
LTFDLWPTQLCAQLIQCASIVTACIPQLRPFLESLHSGMLCNDDLRRRGQEGPFNPLVSKLRMPTFTKNLRTTKSSGKVLAADIVTFPSSCVTTVDADSKHWETESQASQVQFIKQTRTWEIHSTRQGSTITTSMFEESTPV